MNKIKTSICLSLALLCFIGFTNAQTDFRAGFVVLNIQDTLFGQIDYRSDLMMSDKCKFKAPDNRITEYGPKEVVAFRFKDSRYFVTRVVEGKKFFLEYLIHGQVNIYYMRDEKGDHYYIDKDGVELHEIPYEYGMKYNGEEKMLYESKKHLGLLNHYMRDAPKIESRIKSIKKPEHKNLIKLAKYYHNSVCDDYECIIYTNETPALKVLPELTAGVIKYSKLQGVEDEFSRQIGVIGHVWMPRTNEKLYFRTGALFTQVSYEDGKRNTFKIPCQLEYIYPKGRVRPRVAYGLNFYQPIYTQTVSVSGGLDIKVAEKLKISLTSDVEFFQNAVIAPGKFLAHSFLLGVKYEY